MIFLRRLWALSDCSMGLLGGKIEIAMEIPAEVWQHSAQINGRVSSRKTTLDDFIELTRLYMNLQRPGRVRECLSVLLRIAPDNAEVQNLYSECMLMFSEYWNVPPLDELSKPNILIIGSYLGEGGNTGDSASRLALDKALRKRCPDCRVQVMTRVLPQHLLGPVVSLHECGPAAWYDLNRTVKLAIVLGGGIVEPRGIGVQTRLRALERNTKIPIVWLGVAADYTSSYTKEELNSIRESLRRCDRVFARDPASQQFLRELAPDCKIELCPDVTLLLEPQESYVNFGFGLTIGLNVRPTWNCPDFHEKMAGLCDLLIERYGARLVFFPFAFVGVEDMAAGREILGRMSKPEGMVFLPRPLPPPRMLDAVSRVDMMISMRLHSNLFAFGANIPFAGICYHPKVNEFCNRYGGPESILYEGSGVYDPNIYGYAYDYNFPNAEAMFERVGALVESRPANKIGPLRRELNQIVDELCSRYLLKKAS